MKKFIFVFFFFFFFLINQPVFAQEREVNLYFFFANGCPHCANEEVFLKKLENKYPNLSVQSFEIISNRKNSLLLAKIGKKLNADTAGVPFTVIGEQYVIGFLDEQTTGKQIEDEVQTALKGEVVDVVSVLLNEQEKDINSSQQNLKIPETIYVPVFGSIQIKNFSLPILTFVIALLDGFNPCALWVLLLLISFLLGMKDKKRMWILGMSFIGASAFVYFLFLAAWLNLFLFLGFIVFIRLAIGVLAILAGGYYLRDYIVNRNGGCEVINEDKRKKFFRRIKDIIQKEKIWIAIGGIILLASSVNLIEAVCSIGLPAIYTRILSLSNLSTWQYYLYLIFYVFIFILNQLIIFIIAIVTLKSVGVKSKYSRYSHLIGGIIMLVLGIIMIFKPQLLMFS